MASSTFTCGDGRAQDVVGWDWALPLDQLRLDAGGREADYSRRQRRPELPTLIWASNRFAKAEWAKCIARDDTELDRDVALKVLPQAVTEDPDRLARFKT